ncbi:hypothetical protein [Flavobacterium phage FL-1]|nr:hypothetical protein [Flavobacterium phage FL-1]
MSISTGATDMIGAGGAGYGFGGFGGIAPIGLIGLNTFLGGRGFGNDGFGDGRGAAATAGTTVLEQNVSNIREEIGQLGNEMQSAFATQNLSFSGYFRDLDNRLCESEKTQLQSAYAQSLQAFQNTQAIQGQITAFQVANDKEFCAIKSQINADGDATRALITQNLIDGLRNELLQERRGRENREIEINIANTATATQAQVQGQIQAQTQLLANSLNLFGDQLARQTNSIVNLGTMSGSGQTNTASQTKVNS